MLPSDLMSVARIATEEGRAAVARIADTAGAAEAAAVVEAFGDRMMELGRAWARGAMTRQDVARAIDSQREALVFNLAAITNENKRAIVLGILEATLNFLARLFGARLN